MTSIPDGSILSGAGYRHKKPYLDIIHKDGTLETLTPYTVSNFSLDTSIRFCTGWYDMEQRERHACPESSQVDAKYDTCPACQRRTGFNPAFYHATSVSEQQERRNAEPHAVYLAYFAPGVIKVGISHAPRAYDRLLEQGARYAYILEEAPTALIARSHEAKIASLPSVRESVQASIKRRLLSHTLSETAARQELDECLINITNTLQLSFKEPVFVRLDPYYFPGGVTPQITTSTDITNQARIIGAPIGMIGSTVILDHGGRLLHVTLKKYVGYKITTDATEPLEIAPEQTSLF